MNLKIALHFNRQDIDRILGTFRSLTGVLKPIRYSENERITRKSDLFENESRFKRFREKNTVGYLLHAKSCMYNLMLDEGEQSRIEVYFDDSRLHVEATALLRAMAATTPIFGFVGTDEEHHHRNTYHFTLGINEMESEVGYNLDKYIPGLYWLTLVSDRFLKTHGVDLDLLSNEAVLTESLYADSVHLIKFYETPEEWTSNAGRLDDLCERIDGVFSIRSIDSTEAEISDIETFADFVGQWG